MSYFSDIDLATLHRSRLNERIQYKLSWFNRRQKHSMPVASKSVCQHDNPTTAPTTVQKISAYAKKHHKFNANAKATCQSINGLAGMKASDIRSNDQTKITATPINRQRKNGYTNNNTATSTKVNNPTTSFNDLMNRWNRTMESTAPAKMANELIDRKHHFKSAIPSRPSSGVNQSQITKWNKCEQNQTSANSIETMTADRCTSADPIGMGSSNRPNGGSCRTGEFTSSRDAANGVMLNKKNVIPLTDATAQRNAAIDEHDLEIPHRKRSGTWP